MKQPKTQEDAIKLKQGKGVPNALYQKAPTNVKQNKSKEL